MKILFLQKRILFPSDTGGKIRTLNVLRHLARWHDVTYLCNVQDGEQTYLPAMRQLGVRLETLPWRETSRSSPRFWFELVANLFSAYPYNASKDYDPKLQRRARELLGKDRFDLIVCDFVQMARNVEGLTGVPKVLFQHNVEAEIFRRHAQSDAGWFRRQYMAHQWRKMTYFEGSAGSGFDAVVAVSQRDRQTFELDYGWKHVEAIDTSVDLDYFRPGTSPEQSELVVFVGSMDWLPNEDGVEYFCSAIWPLVRERRPEAIFRIVGRNPSPRVQRLARIEGVEVSGTVPDVRPMLADATVVVVPLRVGGGTRIKIFEALAMEKAVVSTSLGAEGLPVDSGENILLADAPHHFAEAVVDLLEDDERRRQLGEAGRKLVEARFSTESVARQFEAICLSVVDKSNGKQRTRDGRNGPTGRREDSQVVRRSPSS